MADSRARHQLSRRAFGGVIAGSGLSVFAAQQAPPPGSDRHDYVPPPRPVIPDVPPFWRSTGVLAGPRAPQGRATPDDPSASAAEQPLSRRARVESQLHVAARGQSALVHVPRQCRPAGRIGKTARRMGTARERIALERAAQPFLRSLPFSERIAIRLHRRHRGEGQSRLHRRGARQVSAEARRHVSKRVSRHVVRPSREGRAGVGTVLYDPQNHGGSVRRVSPRGKQSGAASARADGGVRSLFTATRSADCTRIRTSRRPLPQPVATRSRAIRAFTMSPTTFSTRSARRGRTSPAERATPRDGSARRAGLRRN
jgi:hypothetical protein